VRRFRILGFSCLCLIGAFAMAATNSEGRLHPSFEVDPWWPKPLPDKWITGRLGTVCVDSHDHVIVTNRRDITDEERETSTQAPSVLFFDLQGNLVQSWDGDWEAHPGIIHGCFADSHDNIWITGSGDGIIQKYSHAGKLLLQIGVRGSFDTSDGTEKGKPLNSSRSGFFNPAALTIDPLTDDVYVADGYGNRRVAVFNRDGQFLRQWGEQATTEETASGAPAKFAQVVHCITMSRAGLLYVCDRQGNRIQVFDKLGNFQRNIWINTGTSTLPDRRGTAWWVGFSSDQKQRFLYVMDGRNEQVRVLDHASGAILSSFGRPGHQLGNFTHGHTLAVDSTGAIYVAETDTGRRIQKFKLTH
jgi:DNA-binding beta-propeller fold protein YncE